MSVQINTHELQKRYVELEAEKSAIETLLTINNVKIPSLANLVATLREHLNSHTNMTPAMDPPGGLIPAVESGSSEAVDDKPPKRHYKKRKTSGSPEPVGLGDPDVLKGEKEIAEYIGASRGTIWYLKKAHNLPAHAKAQGSPLFAKKLDLRIWVQKHPKYKITETIENLPADTLLVTQSDEPSGHPLPSISGRTKIIHKRCKGCNIMIHREVPEDFNESTIKFHSPECKKDWELDHKAGKA